MTKPKILSKRILYWTLIPTVAISFFLLKKLRSFEPQETQYSIEQKRMNGKCPGKTIEKIMQEPGMEKSLPLGSKYQEIPNWYSCHPVELGDLVLYRYAYDRPAVIREVVAVSGDTFMLQTDDKHSAWNLFINKKILKNKNGEPYTFGNKAHAPSLQLYSTQNQGRLTNKNFIVFSQSTPGYLDSGMFGVVHSDDFIAKIVKVGSSQ